MQTQPLDIDRVVALGDRLSDLLAAEVAALRAMRPQDIVPLQEEKAALAVELEAELKALRAERAGVAAATPERRAALSRTMQTLSAVVADDVRALNAARSINERLLKSIAAEVADKLDPPTTYGPRPAAGRAGPGGRTLAFKLDARA